MNAPDFRTVYDFSVIELAVETLAAQANPDLTWVGADAAAQFQKARPRVECYLEPGQPFGSPPHYVNTKTDNARRINGWLGNLRTMIITPTCVGDTEADASANSYALHNSYRSFVDNFMATLDSTLADNPILLPYHQVARCWPTGNSPKITPQTGYYVSQMNHNVIYSIRPTAWPGGIINA